MSPLWNRLRFPLYRGGRVGDPGGHAGNRSGWVRHPWALRGGGIRVPGLGSCLILLKQTQCRHSGLQTPPLCLEEILFQERVLRAETALPDVCSCRVTSVMAAGYLQKATMTATEIMPQRRARRLTIQVIHLLILLISSILLTLYYKSRPFKTNNRSKPISATTLLNRSRYRSDPL